MKIAMVAAQGAGVLRLAVAYAVLLNGIVLPKVFAIPFTVSSVGFGTFTIDIPVTHVGPGGAVIDTPNAPDALPFRPPSIFSAPLPTGSGARALGLGGAFTAIADDATAASWNPAGLIQLERPEGSVMYRYDTEKDRHHSTDSTFAVGQDDFNNHNLNYLSAVVPFYSVPLRRNAVFSMNYQETYDFETRFSADLTQQAGDRSGETAKSMFDERQLDSQFFDTRDPLTGDGFSATIEWVADLNTEVASSFDRIVQSELLTGLEFEQQGVIDALTPALAVEVTPKLSVGAAFNYFMDSPFPGREIRSHTRATYSGRSRSDTTIATERTTSGTVTFLGSSQVDFTFLGGLITTTTTLNPTDISASVDPFTETDIEYRRDTVVFDGEYEEFSAIDDLHGYSGTFGFLWTLSRRIGLGGTLDLPWTAKAQQTSRVTTKVTTLNESRTKVLDVSESSSEEVKDVEFEFPLYWALGMVLRWTPYLYTSLDVSQTTWSDFSFKAEGQPRVNPLDGSPHGLNPLDDTWSVRGGMEYLKVGRKTEIPFRIGGAWEQRPALGKPDEFYSLSAGTGIGVGEDNRKLIIDIAYIYTFADGVQGLVADQPGLTTDVRQHQGFVSLIRHF